MNGLILEILNKRPDFILIYRSGFPSACEMGGGASKKLCMRGSERLLRIDWDKFR